MTQLRKLVAPRQPWTLLQHFGATVALAGGVLIVASILGGLL